MNWSDPSTYSTVAALLCGTLMAFGLVVADESAQLASGITQIAGGVIALVSVWASIRNRTAKPPAAGRK